jgi:energy-coupling factor transport system permease protein
MDLLRSLPISLYLEHPITWLHRLDARVKLAWLMAFLLTPVLANPWWRLGLVGSLLVLTLAAGIPWRVWKQQMGWLLMLALLIFCLTAILPDGLTTTQQPRRPGSEIRQELQKPTQPSSPWYLRLLPSKTLNAGGTTLLPPASQYRYQLLNLGPIKITRRSLDLAVRTSTLLFTLLYSTTLFLLTTAPEEITAALEELLRPLRRLGLPVTELCLTLTLGLRFIPLVLEEIQNLVRSIRTRAIDWKKLGWKGGGQIWLKVAERLLDNLLLRADQIAAGMQVRGFTQPDRHQVQWHQLRLGWCDWLSLGILGGGVALRWFCGGLS